MVQLLRIIGDKRKRRRSLKDVLDAIFYLLKAGCQLYTTLKLTP
jgi:transposase